MARKEMEIYLKPPHQCTDSELKEFEALVINGGEVIAQGLPRRIKKAKKLVFAMENNRCIGVGAIKQPSDNYKRTVFEKAGVPELANGFSLELGWIYVPVSARGIGVGRKIMEAIVNSIGSSSCFATTRKNNGAMHHLFGQNSFSKLGNSYLNNGGNYRLVLYSNKP